MQDAMETITNEYFSEFERLAEEALCRYFDKWEEQGLQEKKRQMMQCLECELGKQVHISPLTPPLHPALSTDRAAKDTLWHPRCHG